MKTFATIAELESRPPSLILNYDPDAWGRPPWSVFFETEDGEPKGGLIGRGKSEWEAVEDLVYYMRETARSIERNLINETGAMLERILTKPTIN